MNTVRPRSKPIRVLPRGHGHIAVDVGCFDKAVDDLRRHEMAKTEKEKREKSLTKGAMPEEAGGKDRIYQLRVLLVESEPEIWRRVLVSGNTTLAKLHRIMQTVMGWTDSHLHEFVVKGVSYADPDPDMEMDESEDETRVHLYEVAPRSRSTFRYMYDFGDGWEHKITVEKIMDQDERYSGHPVCVEGHLSGPPEDSGGVCGYSGMLDIMRDPKHPEHESTVEWLGDDFDPEEFDLAEINKMLKKMR
jgi:hypothetical protein